MRRTSKAETAFILELLRERRTLPARARTPHLAARAERIVAAWSIREIAVAFAGRFRPIAVMTIHGVMRRDPALMEWRRRNFGHRRVRGVCSIVERYMVEMEKALPGIRKALRSPRRSRLILAAPSEAVRADLLRKFERTDRTTARDTARRRAKRAAKAALTRP